MPKPNPFRLFRITHKDKADRDYDRYRYSNYPREKMGKIKGGGNGLWNKN